MSSYIHCIIYSSEADTTGCNKRIGQTNDYKIGRCCYSAMYAALRSRIKDWLSLYHDICLVKRIMYIFSKIHSIIQLKYMHSGGTGTDYLSGYPVSQSPFSGVRAIQFFNFCLVLCRSLLALFLLVVVFSVLFRFTVSDYPFGIFKLVSIHYIFLILTVCIVLVLFLF